MNVNILFAFVAITAYSNAAFVDNLPKCRINDNECMRAMYQSVVHSIGQTGIPELKIPRVDPIAINNITVKISNILDVTLIRGFAKGLKNCVFQKFRINLSTEFGIQENMCNVTVNGHYKSIAKSPLLIALLGRDVVKGDGNLKVKIEKVQLKFRFPFYIQKRDDGEIYIKCIYNDIKYTYKVGRVNFMIDNIFVGNQDSSELITDLLNDNWRFAVDNFGQPFVDTAMNMYFNYAGNFFDVVPARYFIIDDLTSYAKP